MAEQRGYQIVEYTDTISGAKARRPGLDAIMRDARRGQFDVVLVWACDRIARSVRHFLELLDEFNRLNIRVRLLPRTNRHRRPVGKSDHGDRRCRRRARAQLDRRAGARRHAARQARRPAHRTEGSGPRLEPQSTATARTVRAWANSQRATWCPAPLSTGYSASKIPAVTKGLEKTGCLNLTESWPDLIDPAVPQGVG